jgi:hypothetical protein
LPPPLSSTPSGAFAYRLHHVAGVGECQDLHAGDGAAVDRVQRIDKRSMVSLTVGMELEPAVTFETR